jgi:hypothetical protein
MCAGYRIKGMAEEGTCEHCGANCPKRRVYVETAGGDVQAWGVICASKVRGGKGKASEAELVAKFARWADALQRMLNDGATFETVWRRSPFAIVRKGDAAHLYYPGSNVPDAVLSVPATA